LSSKKYAVDLAIEIMQYLPENFSLEIYGKGHYEKQYQKQIQQLNLQQRVHIKNSFIDRADLNNFFSNYGVFLVPTRMDAQGVSMCEAMSSGLLTVSSNNTAIPEFIENLKNGIIGNDLKEVAKNLIKTVESQNQYKKITTKGRASMENIDITITVNRELSLLNKVASFNE
jgi:glycosyltransferase involved in cell wall biosynthesis